MRQISTDVRTMYKFTNNAQDQIYKSQGCIRIRAVEEQCEQKGLENNNIY